MKSLSFIELPNFTKQLYDYLSEESYQELQEYLDENPTVGKVIPGSDGCRKLRWAAKGHGKRGGARIIYLYAAANGVIWLLSIYAKNEDENISIDLLRKLRRQIDG